MHWGTQSNSTGSTTLSVGTGTLTSQAISPCDRHVQPWQHATVCGDGHVQRWQLARHHSEQPLEFVIGKCWDDRKCTECRGLGPVFRGWGKLNRGKFRRDNRICSVDGSVRSVFNGMRKGRTTLGTWSGDSYLRYSRISCPRSAEHISRHHQATPRSYIAELGFHF